MTEVLDRNTRDVGAATAVVLAVDISSSAVRVGDFGRGLRLLASSAVPLRTETSGSGVSEQPWSAVVDAVLSGLRRSAVQASDSEAAAIALSGTASSLLVTAPAGEGSRRALTGGILWSDRRAASCRRDAYDGIDEAAAYRRTLCPEHVSYWPAKLLYLSSRLDLASRRDIRLGGIKDHVFQLLTGQWWTDPMSAASSGVFDSAGWCWDAELLARSGTRVDQLPEVHPATDTAPLLAGIASEVGLPAGLPVVVGGMDGPLAQLGSAGFSTESATCTVGTSIAVRTGSAGRVADPARRVWCYPVVDGFWVVGGAGSNGGNVLTWIEGLAGGTTDISGVLRLAFSVTPDPGLLMLPYLHGERSPLWDDELAGALTGMRSHHTVADLARAAVESIGVLAAELGRAVRSVSPAPGPVLLDGGLTRHDDAAQLLTDALGATTLASSAEQGTAAGAALLGWAALGADPRSVRTAPDGLIRREPVARRQRELQARAEAMRELRTSIHPRSGPGP